MYHSDVDNAHQQSQPLTPEPNLKKTQSRTNAGNRSFSNIIGSPSMRVILNDWNSKSWTERLQYLKCWIFIAFIYVSLLIGVPIFQGFHVGRNNEISAIELELKYTCDDVAQIFKDSWADTIFLSQSTAALFTAMESQISRADFRRFSNGEQFAGVEVLQAIEWIPYVQTEQERVDFEAEGKAFTLANPGIFGDWNYTFQNGGRKESPANTGAYFPVQYVEPVEGNEVALGFNLASNPVRLTAIQQSWSEKVGIASARITLVQSVVPQFGFLYFTPMYDAIDTSQLTGFILAVFKIDEMLIKALQNFELKNIDIFLFDGTDPEGFQYLAHYSQDGAVEKSVIFEKFKDAEYNFIINDNKPYDKIFYDVEVGKRQWRVVCAPQAAYVEKRETNIAWTIFGISISLVVVQYGLRTLLGHQKNKAKKDSVTKKLDLNDDATDV